MNFPTEALVELHKALTEVRKTLDDYNGLVTRLVALQERQTETLGRMLDALEVMRPGRLRGLPGLPPG